MRRRTLDDPRPARQGWSAAAGLTLALLLGGCSADGSLGEQARDAVQQAGTAVEDARDQLAGEDQATREVAEKAVARASEAIAAAREVATSDATQAEIERVRTALQDAEEQLAAAAESADGPTQDALDTLAQQVTELADQLRER